ncbi:methyltransferase family protein [Mucilaginibacter frigoritolerans]|jgi:ubiquinone/menaquinone biosynthesis C-methylase UbiE|uniref:Methyltransferase family protein n=2 Tax=Mucilaginibacter frigoritolerans TaxID=652788 RepID=A0A562TKZ1_9SPHI|nr:methyltransferase family protein [Mucilaginibacter frigoritolerans]
MHELVQDQKNIFEEKYALETKTKYGFHITHDPLIRFLRDRRLNKSLDILKNNNNDDVSSWSVLVVCGGVGGEGIFFYRKGLSNITVSDISENSLKICNFFEPAIDTIMLNGESLDLPDNSYDLVVVQDGLHHLPRPVSGFTEMLRVAKKGIVVIEPYNGLVGNLIGTEWEKHGDAVNYVFRWDKDLVTQVVKSLLLSNYKLIRVLRLWDHNKIIFKTVTKLPKSLQLKASKTIYWLISLFNFSGNNMVAVVLK